MKSAVHSVWFPFVRIYHDTCLLPHEGSASVSDKHFHFNTYFFVLAPIRELCVRSVNNVSFSEELSFDARFTLKLGEGALTLVLLTI